MFFPSLPFMGVMLFPSFWLGNASGEGGASLALLSLFLVFLLSSFFFSPLLFSPSLLFFSLSPPFFSPFSFFPFSSSSAFLLFLSFHSPLLSKLFCSLFLHFSLFHLSFSLSFASFSCSFSFCLSPLSSASFPRPFFFFFWELL